MKRLAFSTASAILFLAKDYSFWKEMCTFAGRNDKKNAEYERISTQVRM